MPPFSAGVMTLPFAPKTAGAKGTLPNSTISPWPIKPCHASVVTQGGSIRPVEGLAALLPGPFLIEAPVQSAVAQYTAPGTRRFVGRWNVSAVLAKFPPIAEQGGGGVTPAGVVQSAAPPAS